MRRRIIEVAGVLGGILLALLFLVAPPQASADGGMGGGNGQDGGNGSDGRGYSCSCVNGVCSGTACPRTAPPPPPPPPPTRSVAPPPPPRRATAPSPSGDFVNSNVLTETTLTPTAQLSADAPSAGVSKTALVANTDSDDGSSAALQALGAIAALSALALGATSVVRSPSRRTL
jgi:hypothetical protein